MSDEKLPRGLNVENWVSLYSDYLYNYATYRVNNTEEARDLVQDTFLSALKAKDSFRHESNEKTWLVSVLKNKIIDYYRKKSTQSMQESLDKHQIAGGYNDYFNEDGNHAGHWSDAAEPKTGYNAAYQQLENKEFYDILNRCLGVLPQKWAAIFRLKNMEDVETDDICKELNITPSNYWVMMHRAKLQLRQCMETNWLGVK
jgi:RNA polymerase sigma-70 factor (TIGR02943 family)